MPEPMPEKQGKRRFHPLPLAGCAAVVLFLTLVAQFWHPVWGFTAFLQLDASNDQVKIAAFKTLPVYVYRNTGGYDGLYYAQLAYHPMLNSPELRGALDSFHYRARRILPAALAWLLSLGRPAWIVHAYSLLNVGAWLVLALLLWRLLPVSDWRGWAAWAAVLFSTGTLASVRLALTDLPALAILAAAMLAAERARGSTAAALLGASALSRETSLLAIGGVVQRPWRSTANALRAAVVVAPLAAWLLYIRWSSGPGDAGWSSLSLPLTGLVGKLGADIDAARHFGDRFLAWTTLAATIGLMAQGAYLIAHPRWSPNKEREGRWWRVGVAYVALMLCLGNAVWEGFPGAATRVLLPLTLAFNVLAVRDRAGLAWLLVGNLAVVNGARSLLDVPRDRQELAATHVRDAAVIARADDRWDVESRWRRTSASSGEKSAIDVETWPHDDRLLQIETTIRGRVPVELTIAQDGAILWRNTIFGKPLRVKIPCRVREGHAHLEFAADLTGLPPGALAATGGRVLAVEDLRLRPPAGY